MSSNSRPRNALREVPRLAPLSLRFVHAFVFLVFTSTCFAQSQVGSKWTVLPTTATADEPSEDLLKAAQNPVSDLISVPILNTANFNIGTYSRTQNVLAFQPVIPANLSENWMLISRIILPITSQPYPDKSSGGQFGLGDMAPSFFLAPRKPGSVILGAGPAMVIPTATSSTLGQI